MQRSLLIKMNQESINTLYKFNPWWEDNYQFDGIIRPSYLKILAPFLNNSDIVFLTGLRRVGKTSLLKNLIAQLINEHGVKPSHIFYISLDLYSLNNLSIGEIINQYRIIHTLKSNEKITVFLDEVTHKKSYQQELKNLYDLGGVKIFASSSSASLLKDKNAYLTGRQRIIEIMPLDFKEYLAFKKINIKHADQHLLKPYFEAYMQTGGLPEFVLTDDPSYLQNLVESIIYKDIIAQYNIRSHRTIEDFYKLLMERSGKQLSLNKMANILGISVDSARRYLTYFEQTYLIYSVPKFGKLNETLKSVKKVYSGDVGLKNFMTGFRDKGAIFENLVFLKIKSQKPCYLYQNGVEIDFITANKTLIEVKYHSVLNKKQQQLFDNFEAKDKQIISNIEAYLQLC